jgi:hypothetical protein
MTLVYNAAGELREIPDELLAAWAAAGNPKSAEWMLAPAKPTEDAIWEGSQWVIPSPAVPESVSARQIRLWLVAHGVSLAAVESAIDAIPDALQRDSVRVEWEYAPYVERSHPMLVPLAAALGLTEEQVDQAFVEAATL